MTLSKNPHCEICWNTPHTGCDGCGCGTTEKGTPEHVLYTPFEETVAAEKKCICTVADWQTLPERHRPDCPCHTTDTSDTELKDYFLEKATDPALIHQAAEEGAKDQDDMLARDDTSDLENEIVSLVGEATMCWEPIPSGEFDSDEAMKVAFRIVGLVRTELEKVRTEAREEGQTLQASEYVQAVNYGKATGREEAYNADAHREAYFDGTVAGKAATLAEVREKIAGMRKIERYPLAARIVVDEKNINYNIALFDLLDALKD